MTSLLIVITVMVVLIVLMCSRMYWHLVVWHTEWRASAMAAAQHDLSMTAAEAVRLGVHPDEIREMIRTGKIPERPLHVPDGPLSPGFTPVDEHLRPGKDQEL
jgi:hypothetical protein